MHTYKWSVLGIFCTKLRVYASHFDADCMSWNIIDTDFKDDSYLQFHDMLY